MSLINDLNQWFNYNGIDLNKTTFDLNQYDYDLHKYAELCKHTLEFDETNVSTIIYLKNSFSKYLSNHVIDFEKAITNDDSFIALNNKIKELRNFNSIINSQQNQDIIDNYKNNLKNKLNKIVNIDDCLENENTLADIIFKSLNPLSYLNINQFYKGIFSDKRPIFSQNIYEFKNINELVSTLANTNEEALITLNLIKNDEIQYESFFTFGIKNGQNIYLLNDKNKEKNPLKKFRTRKADKSFYQKVNDSFFPYDDVFDLQQNTRGGLFFNNENTLSDFGLTKNFFHKIIKPIKDLNAENIIWIYLMFEYMEKTYFKNKVDLPLNYSGALIYNKELDCKNKTALAIFNKNNININLVTTEDVLSDKELNIWDRKPTKKNMWIEKKFEKEIDSNNLNLIEQTNQTKFIEYKNYSKTSREILTIKENFLSLKLDDFGTINEIKNHKLFIARYNKALMIKAKHIESFNSTKQQIIDWYCKKLKENKNRIYKYLAEGELNVTRNVYSFNDQSSNIENILKKSLNTVDFSVNHYHGFLLNDNDNKNPDNSNLLLFVFNVINSEAISKLLNIAEKDLPDELKYFTVDEPYEGNSILEHLDPMDYVVKNLWNTLKLSVKIYLTKSEYNELRKQYKLPPNKFWN